MTLAADAYSVWVLDGDGPGSPYWAHVAAWASPLLGWPAFTALIMVFLISPDGHLPSPRWRWAVVGHGGRSVPAHAGHPDDPPRRVRRTGREYGDRTVSEPLLTVGYLSSPPA